MRYAPKLASACRSTSAQAAWERGIAGARPAGLAATGGKGQQHRKGHEQDGRFFHDPVTSFQKSQRYLPLGVVLPFPAPAGVPVEITKAAQGNKSLHRSKLRTHSIWDFPIDY